MRLKACSCLHATQVLHPLVYGSVTAEDREELTPTHFAQLVPLAQCVLDYMLFQANASGQALVRARGPWSWGQAGAGTSAGGSRTGPRSHTCDHGSLTGVALAAGLWLQEQAMMALQSACAEIPALTTATQSGHASVTAFITEAQVHLVERCTKHQ